MFPEQLLPALALLRRHLRGMFLGPDTGKVVGHSAVKLTKERIDPGTRFIRDAPAKGVVSPGLALPSTPDHHVGVQAVAQDSVRIGVHLA